jgi:transcriptional regulator with GAF, ATPase, and Fis domain
VEYLTRTDHLARVPLGVGVTGKIVLIRQQIILNDLDKDPGELVSLEWLKAEKIRGFHGGPIFYKDEVVGIISVFTRSNVPDESKVWGHIYANHIGGAIANARAFEEIQRLKAQLEMQNAYLREEVVEAKAFGELVGQSQALRHIVSQIDLVAPTEASVLILGESGTGKELVAREIHQRSRRKDKPLVRVNCASIPKDLFESEFFGHARGAFTGAVKDRAGRFEAAEGGTLFLDEIGEVPLDLQGKLLRVLQEKRYERVGEDRTRLADVRVIAATNRELKQDSAAGRFREDLYYRLNVFPIQVPPLREHMEDIPLLAEHFVELSVRELRCPKPRITRAGIAKLQSYHWPGNIRELRNVIERAVIISRGRVLDFDLPVAETALVPARRAAREASDTEPEFLTEAELQRRERENLLIILEKANWKIKGAGGAAELLGVNSATLLSRMKKMGLKRPA